MVETETKKMPDCRRLASILLAGTRHTMTHQKRCLKCISFLYEYDTDKFNDLLGRALKSKTPGMHNIVNFAIKKGWDFEGLEAVPRQENPILQSIINSCSPYRIPQDVGKLPENAGVYIVVINNKNSKKVVYVGSSLNVHLRLTTHHVEEFTTLTTIGVELLIYCLLFPTEGTEEAMRETEVHLIHELKPTLNKRY